VPRLKILNGTEQMLFDRPPQMSGAERRRAFELPVAIWSAAHEIQSAPGRIGFLVSAGYFRSARRFFLAADFHERDTPYAAARLGIDAAGFDHVSYPARTRQRHRLQILEQSGFRPFDGETAQLLEGFPCSKVRKATLDLTKHQYYQFGKPVPGPHFAAKMYDKQGSVMRIETTLSNVSDFKTFRTPEGKPEAEKRWLPMRKGIADLHRRAEVSQAANARYLTALASVENPTPLGRLTARLAQHAQRNGRRVRAMNPHAPADAKLFEAIGRGEFTLNGFRNRDLRVLLFADTDAAKPDQRRHAAVVSRQIALLRTHGLIKKVQGTHRYHLTSQGRVIVTALISIRNVGTDVLTQLAA
jgi:Domain of unknown function (DUF4158)